MKFMCYSIIQYLFICISKQRVHAISDPITCMLIVFSLSVIDCGQLPLLSEGQIAYTTGVVTGLETGLNATASYSCSEGYSLVGDMIRTCQANGQWDGAEPTCMCECYKHLV